MSNINNETINKKQRLGRGLGTLLGGSVGGGEGLNISTKVGQQSSAEVKSTSQLTEKKQIENNIPTEARVWNISIDKLVPSAFQPRTHFEKEKLEELAKSIKENGILQPIVARKLNSGAFEIIAGERRWRAAQIAGLHDVPVIIKTYSNKETLQLAIIENIQREDLNPIEEGEGYQRLINEFNLTQQEVSEKVGKDRTTVTNALRLLTLPVEVKEYISKGEISQGHAKVLLSLDSESEIKKLGKKIVAQKLSVRKLEKEVYQIKSVKSPAEKENSSYKENIIQNLKEDLQKALHTKIQIDYKDGKGKITINFYSDDELSSLIDKMKN